MEHTGDAAWFAGAVVTHNEAYHLQAVLEFVVVSLVTMLVMLQLTCVIFAKHSDYIYKFYMPFGFVDLDFSSQPTESMLVCRFCFQ